MTHSVDVEGTKLTITGEGQSSTAKDHTFTVRKNSLVVARAPGRSRRA